MLRLIQMGTERRSIGIAMVASRDEKYIKSIMAFFLIASQIIVHVARRSAAYAMLDPADAKSINCLTPLLLVEHPDVGKFVSARSGRQSISCVFCALVGRRIAGAGRRFREAM